VRVGGRAMPPDLGNWVKISPIMSIMDQNISIYGRLNPIREKILT
jgi:hypothetical protein